MSEEEIIIITNPPKKRFDWTNFTKKLSTLVGAAVVSLGTISASIMAYYVNLTPEQQAMWPFWLPVALVLGPSLLAGLGPVAVAFRQFFEDDTDQAGA